MTYPKATTSTGADAFRIAPSPRFPAVEEAVLSYWRRDDTFHASVERNSAGEDGANEFVFYDGPPFANGLPHYGHLLTGYVKDIVPRFQTMRGRGSNDDSAGTATDCRPSWRPCRSWA